MRQKQGGGDSGCGGGPTDGAQHLEFFLQLCLHGFHPWRHHQLCWEACRAPQEFALLRNWYPNWASSFQASWTCSRDVIWEYTVSSELPISLLHHSLLSPPLLSILWLVNMYTGRKRMYRGLAVSLECSVAGSIPDSDLALLQLSLDHSWGWDLIPGPGTPFATGQPKKKKKKKKSIPV